MSGRKPMLTVNTPLEDAIAAHQEALTCRDGEMGHLALRSVIMAKTATVGDLQRLLDYLTGLPIPAWPADCGEPADVREMTLRDISRSIGWQMAE
jgi:hypothetical protein